MSSVWGAYVPPEYHSGKNEPEQVTEEFLTCRLCAGGFRNKPKILLCGHTFCQPCLERYTCGSRDRAICCPTCARPTCMPETGLLIRLSIMYDVYILLQSHSQERQDSAFIIKNNRLVRVIVLKLKLRLFCWKLLSSPIATSWIVSRRTASGLNIRRRKKNQAAIPLIKI